jgi:hypothetical protein
VRTELTLHLKRDAETDTPALEVAEVLITLGGWMTSWVPEPDRLFGRATFVFADKVDCDRFLRAALGVRGVFRDLQGTEPPLLTKPIRFETSDALRRAPRPVSPA